MLFSLINAPVIFQTYINYIAYFDDILIYSSIYIEYQRYIRQILKRLRQYKLYIKLSKYEFFIILMIFLEFVMNIGGIEININKIKIIAE
jgi:hypothetical protein